MYHDANRKGYEVPYNWDRDLPRLLGEINEREDTRYPVVSVYAADRRSVTGSGRPGSALAARTRPYREYVEDFHEYGIRMKYVLNAPFHGGRDLTPQMQTAVLDVVAELVSAGIDSVTVAAPLLAMVIHKEFPELALSTSVNNHLDSTERVRQLFAYVPYRTIMLDNRHSRNFPLIRVLRGEFPEQELTVLANESCLPDCVLQLHHQDLLANMSRCDGLIDATVDWCHCLCAREKLKDPIQVLKAPWVRPDDAHWLFEAGATTVKLAGRTMNADWILRLAAAYTACRCDEDDVWPFVEKSGLRSSDWEHVLQRELSPCRFVVKNRRLDGFIEPFVQGASPCIREYGGCRNCGHCARWAAKAVEVPGNRETRLDDLQELTGAFLGHRGQGGANVNAVPAELARSASAVHA